MNIPYKRILLAIDQDEVSFQALNEALYLAKTFQANLCILHVIDEAIFSKFEEPSIAKEGVEELEKTSSGFLDKILELAHKTEIYPEFKIIKITKENERIAFAIIDAATAWETDLIIIGAYSRKGIHKLSFGHVAECIVRITDIPTLILHTRRQNS